MPNANRTCEHVLDGHPTPRKEKKKVAALAQLVQGKIRRFCLTLTPQGRNYIRHMEDHRAGECKRCGACCRIVIRCPFLKMEEGVAACAIHRHRPPNCGIFPIDLRDLSDRDQIAPNIPCGYSFPRAQAVTTAFAEKA